MIKHGSPGAWFWNVGGDPKPDSEGTKKTIDSQREWGEIRDSDA